MSKPFSERDDWDLAFATVPRPIYLLVKRLADLELRLAEIEKRAAAAKP